MICRKTLRSVTRRGNQPCDAGVHLLALAINLDLVLMLVG